jgi:hypothetical protein
MLPVELLARRTRELRLHEQLIRSAYAFDLLPGGGHQLRAVVLHDLRTHARGAPIARIEVEVVDPPRCCTLDARGARVPAPVDRRNDHRIGSRVLRVVRRRARLIDPTLECALKRSLAAAVPRRRLRLEALQRAGKTHRRAGRRQAWIGLRYIEQALPDRAGQQARRQRAHEGLEIALRFVPDPN